jgi:hypothetical protein
VSDELGKSSPLADLIGKLVTEGYDPHPGRDKQWSAQCPAHKDDHPSLSISEGDDGKVLLNCFAGCDTAAILRALGMGWRDLFVARAKSKGARRKPRRAERPPAGPYDDPFAFVPACLLENACHLCIVLYGYVALRCGSDNRHQHGWKPIAERINVDWRTAKLHGEYLAACGWLHIHATTTATGAHKAVDIWLAHCPPLKIIGENARAPQRDHASRRGPSKVDHPEGTVVQPMHHSEEPAATSGVCGKPQEGATDVPPGPNCGATDAPLSRYVGSEYVGLSLDPPIDHR